MPDLRKGQYKRIGRIAETNPERAERVMNRMKNRASREDRGRAFADFKPFRDEAKREVAIKRPDTPLADTPKPKSIFEN